MVLAPSPSNIRAMAMLFAQNQQLPLRTLMTTSTSDYSSFWAGRMADLIRSGVTGQQMATNASLFGSNLFQSADETVAYVMGPNGPLQFEGFSTDPENILFEQRAAFQRVVEAQYGTIYERGFAEVQQRAIDAADSPHVGRVAFGPVERADR